MRGCRRQNFPQSDLNGTTNHAFCQALRSWPSANITDYICEQPPITVQPSLPVGLGQRGNFPLAGIQDAGGTIIFISCARAVMGRVRTK